MIELARYFKILFLTLRVSREKLKQFTKDHIDRLTAANPGGIFTPLIANSTMLYDAYFGDLSSTSYAEAVLENRTLTMETSRKSLLDGISKAEGIISYTFDKTSGIYQEFYPQGLTEYNKATLSELETLATRFRLAVIAHEPLLPAGFLAGITTRLTAFTTLRTQQQTQKGVASSDRDSIINSKLALCTQLTKNVLLIAVNFIGDEAKADVYFDQSILARKSTHAETFDLQLSPLQVDTILNTTDPTRADTPIKITNTGATLLLIHFMPTGDDSVLLSPPARSVAPNEEWQGTATDLGFVLNLNAYLQLFNNNTLTSGTCTVRIG